MLSVLSTRIGTLAGRIGARPFLVAGPLLMAGGPALVRPPARPIPSRGRPRSRSPATPDPAAATSSSTCCRPSCCSASGSRCVVAPLTSTLMSSIPERFSGLGLGDQQLDLAGRPAAARGDHLHRDQRDVLRGARRLEAPGLDTSSPDGPGRLPAAQPAAGRRDAASRSAAATQASIDAFHLAMLVSAGLLVVGSAVSWFGLRPGPSPAEAPTSRAQRAPASNRRGPGLSRGPGTARRGRG